MTENNTAGESKAEATKVALQLMDFRLDTLSLLTSMQESIYAQLKGNTEAARKSSDSTTLKLKALIESTRRDWDEMKGHL